jgi:hypothetical protein
MSKQRFNGLSFDINLGKFSIHVKKFTLDITDNSAAAKRNGRPDGWLQGDVEASGKITVDRIGLKTFTTAAKEAKSFQALDDFDIQSYAKLGDDEFKINAYGCKVKLASLLNIDKGSTDETEFELDFDVTSPKFIAIDDVPYITPEGSSSATTK